MPVYELLARLGWPKSYAGKIMALVFVAVHVPMIAAVAFVLLSRRASLTENLDILATLLVATLLGSIAAMALVRALLAPVRRAAAAIDAYLRSRAPPELPTTMGDDAGVLMARIQEAVTRLDAALGLAERRHAELRAVRADKFELLSGMSHELRTPLGQILGFASLLRNEALGPVGAEPYRSYAETIGRSGERLLAILQNILDLSGAEAAALDELPREPVDLPASALEARLLEHLHAERRGVRISFTAPAAAWAQSDARVSKQLMLTALQIAIDDAGERGRVDMSVGTEPDGAVALRIADHGRRMTLEDVPPELRDQAPGLVSYVGDGDPPPEERLSASPTAVRLSLVCSLARLVGAQVALAVRPEGGKTVTVVFSAADGPATAAAA